MMPLVKLLLAALAGILIGMVFFGGLWSTLSGLERSNRPALRMVCSMLLRFAITLSAFYLLARYGGWHVVLVAATGFALMRQLVVSGVRPGITKRTAKS